MKKPRKRNYINNKELYEHLVVYRAQYLEAMAKGEPKPPLPRYICECIMVIPQRLGTKRNFARYSYLDEMIGDAIENVIKCIHNFDPEKSKLPFAYITKVCRNAFFRRIEEEKEAQAVVISNSQRYLIEDQLSPGQIMGPSVELYDNLLEFVQEFEDKKAAKAAAQNKKKDFRKKMIEPPEEFWAA